MEEGAGMIRKRLNRLLGLLCMGILLLGLSGCNEIKVVEMNQGSEAERPVWSPEVKRMVLPIR